MKTSKIINRIETLITNGIVPFVVGSPGIGKTQIAEGIAKNLGWDYQILIPSMMNPTDISGLPFKLNDEQADFLPYGFSHKILNADNPLLVVIDDLIQSTPLMQAALMQMIEARIVGGKRIPDCVKFVVLSNSASHGAGGSKVIEPLKGRTLILHMEVDPKQWIKWGIETKRIEKEVLFYIQTYPESLVDFKVCKDIANTPSPRNWERLSKVISIGLTDTDLFAGCVGESEAVKFSAFLKTINELKGIIPQILKDPATAPLFSAEQELDKVYSIGLALAHNASKENFNTIYTYLNRMGGESKEFILATLLQFHPELKETETYINYICKD